MRIRAFGIGLGNKCPYTDFQDLTLEQAGEAVERSKSENFEVMLYLDPTKTPGKEPAIGLVFKAGVYTSFGLGGDEFSKPIQEKFAPLVGKVVQKAKLMSLLE